MDTKIQRSPQGYAYLSGDQVIPKGGTIMYHGNREANGDITKLWDRYKTIVSHEPPIMLLLDLVAAMKRAIGNDFEQWLIVQVTANPDISGYRLQFLRDTLRFIRGHGREYGLNTWNTLINLPENGERETVDAKKDQFSDVVIPKTATDLISLWLQQPNGADDMFHSANLLFGK